METILPNRSEGCIKGRYYAKLQPLLAALNLSP